ncbi:TPA: pectin acetylesterase-family hydrolase [Pseudomonas aeruginosa]
MSRNNKILILSLIFLMPLTSQADENGYYSRGATLKHLIWPVKPDSKATTEQLASDMYPLTEVNNNNSRLKFKPKRYKTWQTIEMPPSTGAMCMDGSPYKIFVNRVPSSSNFLIYFEPGGMCTDYESCTGQKKGLSAINYDGISDDYLTKLAPSTLARRYITPLVVRTHPRRIEATKKWNIIYAPYCSGDMHAGDAVKLFESETGEKKVIQFRGLKNARSVVSWLKENLERPTQLLVTGASAGGYGAQLNYAHLRHDLAPERSYLLNDSGPFFQIADSSTPGYKAYRQLIEYTGIDNGYSKFISTLVPDVDVNNPISIYAAYSVAFPEDRMGMAYFWHDKTIPRYFYQLEPDIVNAVSDADRERIREGWSKQATQKIWENLNSLPNVGAYFPQYRGILDSHTLTSLDFRHSDIQEENLELEDFIENLMKRKTVPVMDVSEASDAEDLERKFLSWDLSSALFLARLVMMVGIDIVRKLISDPLGAMKDLVDIVF